MPRTSRNCSAKFGFTIQFLLYSILKRMIIIYYFEMCPNNLTHMLNEIQIHATLLDQDILFIKL